jgi:hypothetical protein
LNLDRARLEPRKRNRGRTRAHLHGRPAYPQAKRALVQDQNK